MPGRPSDTAPPRRRVLLVVRGRVQGVGFRPTFYRHLTALGCGGSIRNTPEGVVIEVEGDGDTVAGFVREFRDVAPERARVDELIADDMEPTGETGFRIVPSDSSGLSLLPIPPDLATCDVCVREMAGPDRRRAGYPFNTCTDCGPRFTIARQVPFDRGTNAMDDFPPCERCAAEYADVADRRLHAQTISCPDCGPKLSFLTPDGRELDEPLERTRRMLARGRLLAIKGVGGFHLACDATSEAAVRMLRERKRRPARALAVMVPDLETCERLCRVSGFERELLTSPQAPIVLLRKRPGIPVSDTVAPGLADLGVMLPYTPLHHMLFQGDGAPTALVMTSCNRAEEPIAVTHEHVLTDLADLVDGVLTNDRPIENRCDDSVVAAFGDRLLPMRRSRGWVPEPVMLDTDGPPILATGAMMKNTFALTSGRRVFMSQHIGDVSDADNAAYFERSFEEFSRLLRLEPEAVVCDLHPDYPTSRFARRFAGERGLPLLQVQHHHAHIASCLAEHGRTDRVIGVSWDGSGYGEDGAVWGGEFLIADRAHYERRYHLAYVPMPGGEGAVGNPCRMAAAHVARALGPDEALARLGPAMREGECEGALAILDKPAFSPLTSSAGRLFDAVSALLGVCLRSTYEGQAACELEAVCGDGPDAAPYPFDYDGQDILLGEIWRAVCADVDARVDVPAIARRFHATLSRVILETCRRLRDEEDLSTVALSGGVMQNRALLGLAVPALEADGFSVLLQTTVPPNDAGIALGQAASAFARMAQG